jgi:hypothetical protein
MRILANLSAIEKTEVPVQTNVHAYSGEQGISEFRDLVESHAVDLLRTFL